jgi:hypothetical protein
VRCSRCVTQNHKTHVKIFGDFKGGKEKIRLKNGVKLSKEENVLIIPKNIWWPNLRICGNCEYVFRTDVRGLHLINFATPQSDLNNVIADTITKELP